MGSFVARCLKFAESPDMPATTLVKSCRDPTPPSGRAPPPNGAIGSAAAILLFYTKFFRGLPRRRREQRAGGAGEGGGELAVLQEFARRAIEHRTDRREIGEVDMAGAGLDAVIG